MSVFRLLLVLLLACNAILLTLILHANTPHSEPLAWFESPHEPQRLVRQIDPEHLHVQALDPLAHLADPPASPLPLPATGTAASVPVASAALASAVTATPSSIPRTCLEIGGFPLAQAAQARSALIELLVAPAAVTTASAATAAGESLQLRAVQRFDASRWWVHMPAYNKREDAQRKLAELRQLGVTDYFLMSDTAAGTFTLSLGLFKTKDAAQALLEKLRTQGVRSALVSERAQGVARVWLQFQLDPQQQAQLRAALPHYPTQTLQPCAGN